MRPAQIEVEALRAFRANGQHVEVGARVVLDLDDALLIIGFGKAKAVGDAARRIGTVSRIEWSEPPREQIRGSRWMSGAAA